MQKTILAILSITLLAACSTTSGLKDDEVLYTGIKSITIDNKKNTYAESIALEEIEAALAYAPNNSFMGSSSVRFPVPIGLWTYNKLVDHQTNALSKWVFNTFGSTPITMQMVNPATRTQVATNTLQNYGYFQGKVDYTLLPQKNPKKSKISYDVHLGEPYMLDSIHYLFPAPEDSVVRRSLKETLLKQGDQFSALNLQLEKDRIATYLRNHGYYYYRPDYIALFADSMMTPQRVKLLVAQDKDTPLRARHPWYIGKISAYIRSREAGSDTRERYMAGYTDSVETQGLKIAWSGKKNPIAPRVMFRNFHFWHNDKFSEEKIAETVASLSNMQVFSGLRFSYTPRDTTALCDTLDIRLDAEMDQLIDAELDFNITQKSNSQVGPHATITLSKRNAFGHGEKLAVKLKGSYEWQTVNQHIKGQDQINSYEAGIETSITYPWLVFPGLANMRSRYANSTSFRFDIDHLNRSGYYRLLSFTAEAEYKFQTSRWWSHRFVPVSLTYDRLEHTTARFDSIAAVNSALLVSLQDQFIPALHYTATFTNNAALHTRSRSWIEMSVKEAGNLVSLGAMAIGKRWQDEGKRMFSTPYSQFFKFTLDYRNKFKLSSKSVIASRLYCGVLWSYGNSSVAPYSELFYVGGANDIRAFSARSIGPGGYADRTGRGTYLDQAGDFKLEGNVEYRFNMVSNLYGALFLDAGNVWLLQQRQSHPDGHLGSGNFLRQIALGTGFGFRYDMEFIVLRLDLGYGLHNPAATASNKYFNIPRLKDALGFHFAVGYPF